MNFTKCEVEIFETLIGKCCDIFGGEYCKKCPFAKMVGHDESRTGTIGCVAFIEDIKEKVEEV